MAETLPALPLDVMEIGERAAQFARPSRAPATERAHQSDWSDFVGWCRQAGVVALPAAATVGAYLAYRADSLRVATLNRQLAAITAAHRMAGQGFVCDRRVRRIVLAGIRRA